ncbi:MAG: cell wall hydrolase [Hypericibacter sp.]
MAAVATLLLSGSGLAAGASEADLQCLALTIYHEARGEPELGKLAVAHVVINRAHDPRFPMRICDVVYQKKELRPRACEFSWTCDPLSDQPRDAEAWLHSMSVARQVYWGLTEDPTAGAMWFHADYVRPEWADPLAAPQRIGHHLFYRDRNLPVVAGGGAQETAHPPEYRTASLAGAEPSIPAATTQVLKRLRVTMILYAANLQDRVARINGALYRAGDPLSSGLTVATIFPDAIVVRYQDRWFRITL